MKIVGIDAGYVNFAYCLVDSDEPFRPVTWVNEPLFTGKFSEERLAREIYAWVTRPGIKAMLDSADAIVLERQMMKRFQAVNHCIRFRYFDKTIEKNPNSVGKDFALPTDRRSKKKAAVDLVACNCALPIFKGKKDDLADAYLLAIHEVFLRQPQLKEGWKNERPARQPAKKRARKTEPVSAANRRLARADTSTVTDSFQFVNSYGNGFSLV